MTPAITRWDARCRLCDNLGSCRQETVSTQVRDRGGDGDPVESIEDTTGQCDDCLEQHGADEYCNFIEDTREADYERANEAFRETHGGEL